MEKTIDADGHVLEHWDAWEGLPDDHRPCVVTDERGLDHVSVAGKEVFVARLGQMGTPGTDVGAPGPAVPLESARPGAYDPVARLVDMDAEGIDVAVLYPTIGLGFGGITDCDAAVAVARAYNDWLAAYCSAAPNRLHGAAMVPFQDVGAAVAELRRAPCTRGSRWPCPRSARTASRPTSLACSAAIVRRNSVDGSLSTSDSVSAQETSWRSRW